MMYPGSILLVLVSGCKLCCNCSIKDEYKILVCDVEVIVRGQLLDSSMSVRREAIINMVGRR
jgi:hypothetical protein